MITANIASSGPNYRHSERNRDSFTSVDLKDLVEERDNLEVGGFLKTILVCLFQGWDGNRGLPCTLLYYQIEPYKKGPFLLLPSSIARNSSAP